MLCLCHTASNIPSVLTGEFPVMRATITEWTRGYRSGLEPVFCEYGTNRTVKYNTINIKDNTHVGDEVLIQYSESLGLARVIAVGGKKIEAMLRSGIPNNTDVKANVEYLIRRSKTITIWSTLAVVLRWIKPRKEYWIKSRKIHEYIVIGLLSFGWISMIVMQIGSESFMTEHPMKLAIQISYVGVMMFLQMSFAYLWPWSKIVAAYKYCREH